MANTFLKHSSRNIGNTLTSIGSYTVSANVGAVVIGLSVSNTSTSPIYANIVINNGTTNFYIVHRAPIPVAGTLVAIGGDQKLVLQTGDAIQVNSSADSSLDVLMNIMETDGVGLTVDGGGGGGGGPNTYTRNVNYTTDQSAYVSNYGTLRLAIQEGTWNNPSEFLTARSYTSGTSVTITVSGESPFTTTLTSNFSEDGMLPGQWLASIQQAGGMFPYPTGTITTFTIG